MKQSIWILAAVSAAALAACGGGGSSDPAPVDTGAGPSPIVTPAALSLHGVAATGAAIANQPVSAKCATGTGTATSNADGSYTVTVTDGTLPCVLKVTAADGTDLFSVATGTGSTAVANINPVTQLIVASMAGADPAAYFTGFDSSAATAMTTTKVTDAVSAVKTTLAAAGVDLSSIDVLAGTLTPATATSAGNTYDQALDALAAQLAAAGTTLATLTGTVVATSPAAPAPVETATSPTASLPAELLLKPAASNCAALRSGTYRIVLPQTGHALADQTGKITLDAKTLGLVFTDGSTGTWVPNGNCRYLDDNGKSDIVVSPAGVIVMRAFDSATNTTAIGIGFPEQTHTVAELAGSWNTAGLSYNAAGAAYVGNSNSGTVSATGTLTEGSLCENTSTWSVTSCVAQTTGFPTWTVNADGGFDATPPGATVAGGRNFVYRSGTGDLMMVQVDADGSFEVRTPQRTNGMPAVGRVYTGWDVIINKQLLATPVITESTNTVSSVDSVAGTFVRLAKTVGGVDERQETVAINSPRNGYNFRAASATTTTAGAPFNITEWTNLSLRGMGVNALIRPAQKQMMFSVQQ
ncbi:MAG: hypothetical protein ABI702_13375 [Burkholderiales bacterium]